jgi:hypothetical protein
MTVTELVSCFDNFQTEEVKERAARTGGGQQNGNARGQRHGNGNGTSTNHNGGRGRGRGFNNNVGGRGRGRSSTRGGSHAGRGNNSASRTKWCQIEGHNSPPHLWENCPFNKRRSTHDLPQEEQQLQKRYKSSSRGDQHHVDDQHVADAASKETEDAQMQDEQEQFSRQEEQDQKHWADNDKELPNAEDTLNSFEMTSARGDG